MKYFTLALVLSMISLAFVDSYARGSSLNTPGGLPLEKRATCLPCPATNTAGDSRCTYLIPSDNTTDATTGCPSCGCQKCPDGNIYSNNAQDYCKSTPNSSCRSGVACTLQACGIDTRCDSVPFDRDISPCGCACQTCPGGDIYGPTFDYVTTKPLSAAQQTKTCPKAQQPPRNFCN